MKYNNTHRVYTVGAMQLIHSISHCYILYIFIKQQNIYYTISLLTHFPLLKK